MGAARLVRRFTRTERALHWVLALGFFALLASGLILYLPELSVLVARRPLIKTLHLYTGIGWLLALALVILAGDRKNLLVTVRELDRFDEHDRRWLRHRPSRPGRFNAGQKLNAAVTAAFVVLFSVSGLLLWYGERDTRFRFAGTILLHDGLMYVALVLLAGHLYLVLIRPATRHSLRGMTTGYVRADWARRRHPRWLDSDREARKTGEPRRQPHQLAGREQDAEGDEQRAGGDADDAPMPA
jgi:formate dehydrogenase subunit gamma